MKKEVMITVDSKQEHPDKDADIYNFVTEGSFYKEEDNYYISYDESNLTGMEGTTTTFKIEPNSVTLIRFGSVSSLMVFEKGRRHVSEYNTEHGTFEIGIMAQNLSVDLDDLGGHINVEYVIEVNNQVASYTTFDLKVQ
ncbi:MAG TPA: DUF1934 domain-containing protein [Thermoclostridium sp.]|nr:DUF1934 domain-containing protein [Thermoclostridium sp.]